MAEGDTRLGKPVRRKTRKYCADILKYCQQTTRL